AELQRVNGITEPTRVRAGTVLFVPGNAEPAPAVAERIPAATPRASLGAPGTAGQPRMLNTPGEKTAALGDRSSHASAPTAKAGKTGTVDQPQLHFELRQGAKPVDPLPHMEK